MNNNDISLFEKIAFVNNIPDEGDAYQLSKDYPFAVIVTETTDAGIKTGIAKKMVIDEETGKELSVLDTDVNNYGSGNIWIGGNRLTKFVNVDKSRHSIPMDTYSIELSFDQITGILSLYPKAKIENYELVTLFYKDIYNQLSIYVNKDKLTEEYDNGSTLTKFDLTADPNNVTNPNTTQEFLNKILDPNNTEYKDFKTETNYEGVWKIDDIDSFDNSVYMIFRYESDSETGINTVDDLTFKMSTITNTHLTPDICKIINSSVLDQYFGTGNILGTGIYKENGDIVNTSIVYTSEEVEKIKAATVNLRYKNKDFGGRKPGKYVLYKFYVTKNIINSAAPENSHITIKNSNIQFNYDSLVDFRYGATVKRNNTFINPSLNEEDIDLYYTDEYGNEVLVPKNDGKIFIMPGGSINLSLHMKPNNVGKLRMFIFGQCNINQTNNPLNNSVYNNPNNSEGWSASAIESLGSNGGADDDTNVYTNLGWDPKVYDQTPETYYIYDHSKVINGNNVLTPNFSCPNPKGLTNNLEYIIDNTEYEVNGEWYSNKFNFTVNASSYFTCKNGKHHSPTRSRWLYEPSQSVMKLVIVREEKDENGNIVNKKIYDSGNTYKVFKYTYEGLGIMGQRWSSNISDKDISTIKSGRILADFYAAEQIVAIFSKRTNSTEIIDITQLEDNPKIKCVSLNPNDNDLSISLDLVDNNTDIINHETIRKLNTPDLDFLLYENTFPSNIMFRTNYRLVVPCIYKTQTNNRYNNTLQLSYSYHGNLDNSLVITGTQIGTHDERDLSSIKRLDVIAENITGLEINDSISLEYGEEPDPIISYNDFEDPLDHLSEPNYVKQAIPSGTNIRFNIRTQADLDNINEHNNLVAAKIIYGMDSNTTVQQKLDLFKYAYKGNSNQFSLSTFKNFIKIGFFDRSTNNFIDNQNYTGNKNYNGEDYIVVNDGKIVYQSDVNTKQDDIIYLQLYIVDENDTSISKNSTDMLCIKLSRYIVRWLFYIGTNTINQYNNVDTTNYSSIGDNFSIKNDGTVITHRNRSRQYSIQYDPNLYVPPFDVFDPQYPSTSLDQYYTTTEDGHRECDPRKLRTGFRLADNTDINHPLYCAGWSYLGTDTLINNNKNHKLEYGGGNYTYQINNDRYTDVLLTNYEGLTIINTYDSGIAASDSIMYPVLMIIPEFCEIWAGNLSLIPEEENQVINNEYAKVQRLKNFVYDHGTYKVIYFYHTPLVTSLDIRLSVNK